MKARFTISLLCICFIAGLSWMGTGPKTTPLQFVVPPNWPQPRYDFKSNPLTQEGFLLGRKLFFDQRLSRDSTIACADCHQQFAAFSTFEHSLSHGVNSSLTTRNAPALQNLAWQKEFMWDGRISHLDLQPIAPFTTPNEMGETQAGILYKLQHDAAYKKMFKAAFGDPLITMPRIGKALSQYMLLLVSANSKYDKVMRGEATFILPEQLGYAIFKQKCSSCHTEPLFTDLSYRNTGLPLDNTLNDYGRMMSTGRKKDSLQFKVPSLRNVAVTSPYGHDGRFFTLLSVFEHYRKNMIVSPLTDSLLQHRMPLSNYEIGQLTAFLYTLTDTSFLKNSLYAPEGYIITPNFIHRH